jgi:serine/threonine protein kinase/Flp pilus assembly protein TadD
MDADPQKVRSIFLDAVENHAPDQWGAFLDRACGPDAELRKRVEVLLSAHEQANSLLDAPDPAHVATADEPAREMLGTMIGAYKLLEQIGEGGMGTVWMAQQTEPVKRLVAVKLIKAGMDSRQVVARFEAERQALALMDHPNIARVLDAGTTDAGRPYFVMDLVRGVPITRYCDEHHLTPRQRLELFLPVCQAVQHAHQKGIIHRDLKPSNVLVALYDGNPVPKIIDFGIAKAAGQPLTEKTLVTGFGSIIGTLEYMSPEQAEINQLDIDTRSDIYSLGILLYELLTGGTPFTKKGLEKAGMLEMLRVIREQEPSKPSTKLSTADGLPTLAANRGTEPAKLTKLVRGELDWIVMKALEKDRIRRYETANGFAMDVQRHLADEPVQACPPSAWYRFRKFARRNKASLTAACLVALALLLGMLVSTWQAIRATKAEKQAQVQAAKARAVSSLLQEMLTSAHPEHHKRADYTVRELLDDFSERLDKQLKEQPEVEATVRLIMGSAYFRLAILNKSERHLTTALALRRQVFGEGHEQVAEVLAEYAWTLRDMGELEESLARAREALAIYRQRGVRGRPLIKAMWTVQDMLGVQGKYAEAEALALEALAIAREAPDTDYPDVANIMHDLAFTKTSQEPKEAEQLARQSLSLHLRLHGKEHLDTGWGLCALGMALQAQGRYLEAAVHLREALAIFRNNSHGHRSYNFAFDLLLAVLQAQGNEKEVEALRRQKLADTTKAVERTPGDPETWMQRGVANAELHRHREAIADYEKGISLLEQLPTFPNKREQRLRHAGAYSDLANSYAALGEQTAAEQLYKKTLELRKAVLGADHQDTLWTMHSLANSYAAQGRHAEAAKLGEETLVLQRVKLGRDHPDTLWRMHDLADSYAAVDRYTEAVKLYEETLAPRKNGPGAFDTAQSMNKLAWLLATCPDAKVRDAARAVELAKRAIERTPKQGTYHGTLGTAHYRASAWNEAVAELEKSMGLKSGGDSFDWFFLAMAHWKLGAKDKAREWYNKAVQWMNTHQPKNEELRRLRAEAAELLRLNEQK